MKLFHIYLLLITSFLSSCADRFDFQLKLTAYPVMLNNKINLNNDTLNQDFKFVNKISGSINHSVTSTSTSSRNSFASTTQSNTTGIRQDVYDTHSTTDTKINENADSQFLQNITNPESFVCTNLNFEVYYYNILRTSSLIISYNSNLNQLPKK